MSVTERRAEPLPPEERRAALVTAALELVIVHGTDISTRQIAQAAGVAEGTIFRVFPSKDELVQAAIRRAFDPASLLARLAAIEGDDLESSLVEAVEAIQASLMRLFHLMDSLRASSPPGKRPDHDPRREAMFLALADLMDPYRDQLRYDPVVAARRLWLLAFASTHPRLTQDEPLAATEIVSLLLDGVRDRPHLPTDDGGTSC